ncbi:MAG: iron-sulfur cluster assembly accessory protein [Alphaproteobacteria bacterium]|nr:iron-sulfur cluster assembly accessory protein [Alphaproteobacteria bacterium]
MATPGLTARAAGRIYQILKGEPAGSLLRIGVDGGGCSGFQYTFDITTSRNEDDTLIERDGAGVVIDAVSLELIKGSTIDFVDDLMGQSFRIENPNATAACGCGTSFSI